MMRLLTFGVLFSVALFGSAGAQTVQNGCPTNATLCAVTATGGDNNPLGAWFQGIHTSGADKTFDGAVALNGGTTLGNASGDALTINSGTWTLTNPVTMNRAISGVSGFVGSTDIETTISGNADGTSSTYGLITRSTATGTNDILDVRGRYTGVKLDTTAGTMTRAYGDHGFIWLGSGGALTNAYVWYGHLRVDGAGSISNGAAFVAGGSVFGGAGGITTVRGMYVTSIGDATRVTNAYGVHVEDTDATTLVRGLYLQTSAGTGKHAVYSGGTAESVFAGPVTVGSTTSPTGTLDVTKALTASGSDNVTMLNGALTASGSSNITQVKGAQSLVTINTTGASVTAAAYANRGYIQVQSAGTLTNGYVFTAGLRSDQGLITTGGHYTTETVAFNGSGAMTNVSGYRASNIGDASKVTNVRSFWAENTEGATLVAAFAGETVAGTGKYNLYLTGTAQNVIRGLTRIGSTAVPVATLDVAGTFASSGANDVTLIDAVHASTGTAAVTKMTGSQSDIQIGTTSGATGTAFAMRGSVKVLSTGTLTNGTAFTAAIRSDNGLITSANHFATETIAFNGSGAVTTVTGYYSGNIGHATKVTDVYHFRADDTSAASGVRGFLGQVTSGSGKYNLYMSGTAANVIASNLRVGSTTPATKTLDVTGTFQVSGEVIMSGLPTTCTAKATGTIAVVASVFTLCP